MAPPPLVPVAPPAAIPASSLPPTSVAPPNSLVTRTQRWVEENKYLVLGAAVVAAGGMGYYLYANQPPAIAPRKEKSGESSSDEDVSRTGLAGDNTAPKKKKKKSKSKKSGVNKSADQGPLLEERDPEEVKRSQETKQAQESSSKPAPSAEEVEKPSYLEGIPEKSELSGQTAEVSPCHSTYVAVLVFTHLHPAIDDL